MRVEAVLLQLTVNSSVVTSPRAYQSLPDLVLREKLPCNSYAER